MSISGDFKKSIDMSKIAFPSSQKRTLWLINFYAYSLIKRLLDIFFALVGLISLSPLFLIVAILIKREDGGSVFFKQIRTGRLGNEFKIIKFRTMCESNNVHDKTTKDEHTKIGKILRNTSIDELPQLINVLKGDMSFIGPRPWITDYFNTMLKSQKIRTLVKPGITGLAQAKGRNGISIFDKINYDIEYVHHFSFFEDLKVVILSFKAVSSKENADAGKFLIHDELRDLKAKNERYL